ncbi:putative chitin-binding domain type 2 protein [Trypoxylus dichotomus]
MLAGKFLLLSILPLLCACYTFKRGVDITFPVQTQIPGKMNSFRRIDSKNYTLLLDCPEGFFFSSDELKCKKSVERAAIQEQNQFQICPITIQGLLSHPLNCRKFVNCSFGRGTVQNCPEHLLFNKRLDYCDWPEESNCCEYLEGTAAM